MGGSVELKITSFLKGWKYVSKADIKTDLLNLLCIIYDTVLSVSKIIIDEVLNCTYLYHLIFSLSDVFLKFIPVKTNVSGSET